MAVPTIMPANSVSGGYEVDNSLRFDKGSSAHLSRTLADSNEKIWTYSTWIKNCIGAVEPVLLRISPNDDTIDNIVISTSGNLQYQVRRAPNNHVYVNTNQKLRDPSAWYHIVVAVDTTQATDTNRIKFYINGNQVTSFANAIYPDRNYEGAINGNSAHVISEMREDGGDGTRYSDMYLAETHFIDGVAAQTDFGEFDDNGVWIPKAYDGSYGTNGFYLEYKETGTDADASGMGADTSGEDNHFTSAGLAATDVTTDTCTNNFATFNPIFVNARSGFTATATLREGNTGATGVNTSGNVSTIGFDKGKWYWEIKIVTRVSNDLNIGIVSIPGPHSGVSVSKTMMWQSQDDLYFNNNQTNATKTADLVSFDDGDIVAVALDLDASTPNVILYKNGTALNSGNAYNFNANERDGVNFIFPQVTVTNTSDNVLINFGNPAFAISSSNADANGHGNFEYAVPSGYFAICTKNLAEFG